MRHYSIVKLKFSYGTNYIWFYNDKPLCYDANLHKVVNGKFQEVKERRKGILTRLSEVAQHCWDNHSNNLFTEHLCLSYYNSYPGSTNKLEIKQRMNIAKEVSEAMETKDRFDLCISVYDVNVPSGTVRTTQFVNSSTGEFKTELSGGLTNVWDDSKDYGDLYNLIRGDRDISACRGLR